MSDDLIGRARENASERDEAEWGNRVTLEVGDSFIGRWRGETTTQTDYGDQPVYLLWDDQGQPCFMYGGRKVLDRRIRSAGPIEGDSIAIFRGEDETSNGRTAHIFGVATVSNPDPLPDEETQTEIDW